MKFIKYVFFIIYLLSFKSIFCASIPIETVFSDINTDYKYYNELQELYNKHVIYPDNDGKLNPYDLLNRDELVGFTMEMRCNKCTKPNTSLEIIKNYENKNPFFDVLSSNPYSYCISLAEDKKYIDSFTKGFKCENMTFLQDKIPFCPDNFISLEDAVSVILRNSNIFSKEENDKVIDDINSGVIKDALSSDVLPKNLDGTTNIYYGYIRKALDYSIEEYDNLGSKKTFKLLELIDGNIFPKKLITKEAFLHMVYIGLKTNSCKDVFVNNIALKAQIIDNTCDGVNSKCSLAELNSSNYKYDFKGVVSGICDSGIDNINGYVWRFYNKTTGNEIIKYGNYVNDFTFPEEGIWIVNLVVRDNCSNSGDVYNTLYLSNDPKLKSLNVSIDVNTLSGPMPLPISFSSLVGGGNGDYTYVWNFGNSEKTNGRNVDYVYNEYGIYKILLTVSDSNGNEGNASILLKALNSGNCESQDSDNDGVNDCLDLCILIYGKSINKGCPVLTQCDNDCSCSAGKKCNESNKSLCGIKGVCIDDNSETLAETNNLTNKCLEKNNSRSIYGNIICNACPCSNFLDYNSTIRKCDYLFPAITSTGNTDIYGAGEFFEIN